MCPTAITRNINSNQKQHHCRVKKNISLNLKHLIGLCQPVKKLNGSHICARVDASAIICDSKGSCDSKGFNAFGFKCNLIFMPSSFNVLNTIRLFLFGHNDTQNLVDIKIMASGHFRLLHCSTELLKSNL